MSRLRPVGRVTHVYKKIGCVAVKLQKQDDLNIMIGEQLHFEKGDPEKPDVTGLHRSRHHIVNIQINHRDVELAEGGDECAVSLSGLNLPPNNALVYLVLAH